MIIEKRLPEFFLVIGGHISIERVLGIAYDTFAEVMKNNGTPLPYKHIFKKTKGKRQYGNSENGLSQYDNHMLKFLQTICSIIYQINPHVRLSKEQAVKLFYDYFKILVDNYRESNRTLWINQIYSFYSVEVWYKYINENYLTLNRYLETAFQIRSREQSQQRSKEFGNNAATGDDMFASENFIRAKSGKRSASGALEVTF